MISRNISGRPFFLDANRVNAQSTLAAMNQLEKWHTDGVVSLQFPENAQKEAEASSNARRTPKAREYLIPVAFVTTGDERTLLNEIERIIFGDASLSKQDRNDALIVLQQKIFCDSCYC